MEMTIIIALGVALLIALGCIIFILLRKGKSGALGDTGERVNEHISTSAGACRAIGKKNKFEINFEGESVSFLVENGVITQYKSKNKPKFTKYGRGA